MNTAFQDLQNDDNPRNGSLICDRAAVTSMLEELRASKNPLMCQLTCDNGFNLIVGVGHEVGCAQYSSNDGTAPFLMAVSKAGPWDGPHMEFLVGDTPTPIDGRYRIAFAELRDIVVDFVTTGGRSRQVGWEELR